MPEPVRGNPLQKLNRCCSGRFTNGHFASSRPRGTERTRAVAVPEQIRSEFALRTGDRRLGSQPPESNRTCLSQGYIQRSRIPLLYSRAASPNLRNGPWAIRTAAPLRTMPSTGINSRRARLSVHCYSGGPTFLLFPRSLEYHGLASRARRVDGNWQRTRRRAALSNRHEFDLYCFSGAWLKGAEACTYHGIRRIRHQVPTAAQYSFADILNLKVRLSLLSNYSAKRKRRRNRKLSGEACALQRHRQHVVDAVVAGYDGGRGVCCRVWH